MIKKAEAIFSLVPDAEFSIVGSGISGVVTWIKPSQAPVTEEQIVSEYNRLVAEEPMKIAKENRSSAYRTESDPLFFKSQRGEATEAEWLSKVEEIKQRFPY
jgi:hypothetical protein